MTLLLLLAESRVAAVRDDSPVDDGRRMAESQTLETMSTTLLLPPVLLPERMDENGRVGVVRHDGGH